MAAKNSASGRIFARHVAPFAPLALALAMHGVGSQSSQAPAPVEVSATGAPAGIVAAKCDEVVDEQDCHSRFRTGCSTAGGYDAYLNYWKNQLIAPPAPAAAKYLTLQDYHNLDTSIPSGLTRSNQSSYQSQLQKLGEGDIYGVIGYLYYAIHSGAESSNCELTGPPNDPEFGNVDYHIGIGFDASTAQQLRGGNTTAASMAAEPTARRTTGGRSKTSNPTSGSGTSSLQQASVIVEMTPHMRFQYENHIWTLDNLKKVVGREVKVVGQLLIDNEHNLPGQNCATAKTAADRQTCWRASVWELHPVVSFQVCPSDSCVADSTDWVELDQAAQ